jgi:energy-coupling factor transport system ATP-binding protein
MKNFTLNLGYYKRRFFSKKWVATENILQDSYLQLFPGELVALQGKSGSGKSTLFKAILGELPIDGSMELDEEVYNGNQDKWLQKLGIIFQDPSTQFLTTSCYGEVKVSLEAAYTEESEEFIEDKIDLLLERHGLLEYKSQSPWLLSQGQQRRLAVLCMLAGKQKLLLVDEPTYGQDRKHAIEIMDNLNELRKSGTTILFTSHDQDLVEAYADRSYLLENRELKEIHYD